MNWFGARICQREQSQGWNIEQFPPWWSLAKKVGVTWFPKIWGTAGGSEASWGGSCGTGQDLGSLGEHWG